MVEGGVFVREGSVWSKGISRVVVARPEVCVGAEDFGRHVEVAGKEGAIIW